MTNLIPLYPLNLVVFPGEELKLHIFEPRYKELIEDCLSEKKLFGIPVVLEEEMKTYGILMEIKSLDKRFENGELDIQVRGRSVFRILEMVPDVPKKEYHHAIVFHPENQMRGDSRLMAAVVRGVIWLNKVMDLPLKFSKSPEELGSYDVAHRAGLSLSQEYELLCILTEIQRQEYLRRHLKKLIQFRAGLEELRRRARLNGDYQRLSIKDF